MYAIENGFFNKDLIRLARGIDRRKLVGLPWSVDYLIAFTGGLMIPVGHPTAYKELRHYLKQAIKEMEEGKDLLEEDDWDDGPA